MYALGITTIISYGTTQYLFGVLVVPIDATFHWGRASISGAYTLGLIIAGLLTDQGLGPELLVIDEGTFKQVAARDVAAGEEVYFAEFSVDDSARSHWRPFLV